MKRIDRAISRMEVFFAAVSGLGLAAIVLLITVDVVGRSLQMVSLPWTVEFSQYWLIAGTFLSAGWIYREGGLARISIIDEMKRFRRGLMIIASVLTIGAALFGLVFMSEIVWVQLERATSVGTYVRVPRWLVLSPVVIGFALLVYEACRRLVAQPQPILPIAGQEGEA